MNLFGFMVVNLSIQYLFDHGLFDKNQDKIKYLINENSGITDSINHNFGEIRIDLSNPLPNEKILSLHNTLIVIK